MTTTAQTVTHRRGFTDSVLTATTTVEVTAYPNELLLSLKVGERITEYGTGFIASDLSQVVVLDLDSATELARILTDIVTSHHRALVLDQLSTPTV